MNNKKILIILNDLKNGGVERVLSILANYFAQKDYLVYVLAIASNKIAYPLSEKVIYKYIPIMGIYKRNGLFKEFKIMYQIAKAMNHVDPDYVIGFDDSIIIRSIPAAWLQRRKIIVSERIDPSIYGLPMRLVRQIAYDMADAIVFQTKEAKDFFPKRTQRKSTIIPNPLSNGLPFHKDYFNKDIIMACRLREQKNVSLAIDAFSQFYKTHGDYRLVIYGEGSLEKELKEQARKLNIEDVVVFPGHTQHIHEKMSECAMYLSTSDYEGISNSMIEALAIGAPCICTDCPVGGAKMFIKNGENGFLVPTRDAKAISEAMCRLAEERYLLEKFSINSRKIRKVLDTNVICSKWESLL